MSVPLLIGLMMSNPSGVPPTATLMTKRALWQRWYDAATDHTYLRHWADGGWQLTVYVGNVVPSCCRD